jgi:hypothetical protein
MATRWELTIDCAQPVRLAEFWALALGYVDEAAPPNFESWEEWYAHYEIPPEEWDTGASLVDPDGVGPRIVFQQVPEGKVAKNRLHLDVRVGGREATDGERWSRITAAVDRLTAAGATVVRQDDWQGAPHHMVMADPEGNEFCLC